eukprot:g13268.t1
MDLFLDADRRAVTADGYVPRWSRAVPGQNVRRAERSGSSDSSGLGDALVEFTLRLALFAGCVYTSVRFTQYVGKLKEREYQTATRIYLKNKLPARDDINMDKLDFNDHEIAVAQDIVGSRDLETTFDMIGGLGDLKEEIMDIVTLACSREAYLQGVSAPRGILLSGVPGTGKTMLARAIAKESGATFINVRMGAVQQKWVGEGEKMVAAIFSMANKLAPSIIFIDEIDCFMRTRNALEQDHVVRVKTEFMTLWDGLLTERSRPVMVLGTTNRPLEIDPAILRRLSRQFVVGLPATVDQREHILQLIARNYRLADGVCLRRVAARTDGFSGSDLDALFQAAQTIPAREFARSLREIARETALAQAQAEAQAAAAASAAVEELRPARREDAAAGAAGPSSPGRDGGARDPKAVLRDTLVDLSRRTIGAARNLGRMAESNALVRALLGPAEPSVEDAGDARRSALQMRGISQEDFASALETVRPTGELAAAFAAGRIVAERTGQRRPQEQQ